MVDYVKWTQPQPLTALFTDIFNTDLKTQWKAHVEDYVDKNDSHSFPSLALQPLILVDII